MDVLSIAVIGLAIVVFGTFSAKAERSPITASMFFVVVGVGVGGTLFQVDERIVEGLAELTLVLVLFTDATRIQVSRLRQEGNLPLRLLAIGMPLTIGLGAAIAVYLFPNLSWPEALLLAAVLAPTDAALGQAVVSNPRVPVRIRQTLNVESGLNDGIALPVVLVFASLAGATEQGGDAWYWIRFAGLAVTLGPLVGGVVGYFGGRIVAWGTTHGWINGPFQRLAGLGIALLAFAGAELVGGNGFIAAFVAGLVVGNTARAVCDCLFEFGEAEGQLLALLVFLIFGATLVPEAISHMTGSIVLYAALSLTVVRMLPVVLSLLGAGLRLPTLGFLGWFGPRGLASILFVLLVVEEGRLESGAFIVTVVMLTVLGSTFLHGISAYPLSSRYADWTAKLEEHEAEHMPMMEMPLRISGSMDEGAE